jgi:hypothetical protein
MGIRETTTRLTIADYANHTIHRGLHETKVSEEGEVILWQNEDENRN